MSSNSNDGDRQQGTMVNVRQLLEAARQGRREVLPALKECLDKKPELWQQSGNLAHQAQSDWLHLICGKDLYLRESIIRHCDELRASLAGQYSPPLEKLQAERIVALHLQVSCYEARLAKCEQGGATKLADYLQQRCSVADRQLQQAMVNMARIRKMLPRTIQVEVVVSGEVQAVVSQEGSSRFPSRIQVPRNRVQDLLSAARN